MAQILVVDDEVGIRELLSEILPTKAIRSSLGGKRGRRAPAPRALSRPTSCCSTSGCPTPTASRLLKEWAASGQLTMPVVMMSGHGTIDTAVEATRIGALDFLEKPIACSGCSPRSSGRCAIRKSPPHRALRLPRSAARPRLPTPRSAWHSLRNPPSPVAPARRARHARRSCSRGSLPPRRAVSRGRGVPR